MGFKTLIELFYDKIFDILEDKFVDKSEEMLFEQSKIINNYVLKKISSTLWHADRTPIPKDLAY